MLRTKAPARFARVATLAAIVAVATLTACSRGGSESLPTPKPGFCEAAQRYDKRVERDASIAEQITILEKLARNAPKDVAADAQLFLDSMRQFQTGTKAERKALQQDPKVREAVENVNRRAINGCGFFESEPGDGS